MLSRVALEQERMLPTLMDLLRNKSDLELRSITGFLRNLSRHAKDKGDMCTSLLVLDFTRYTCSPLSCVLRQVHDGARHTWCQC